MRSRADICAWVLLILACHSGSSLAQSTPDPNSGRRIVAPIDESRLVALKGNLHPVAQQFDLGAAPVSAPTGRIQLVLRRSTTQQQALAQYLSDLQNPSAPAYHKWLTPAQYGARFGVDSADIQTVESWLQSHGFRIENVPESRNLIEFSGTIDQVQSAFHTSIHTFAIHGETRFANVTEPQIPAALAPVIAGVGPLNNFRPHPAATIGARGTWDPTTNSIRPDLTLFDSNDNPYLFVDPADAATIYDTPNSALNPNYGTGASYTGTGATIGIVGVSNVYMQDVENYRTGFLGESAATANVPTVIIDGNDPGVEPGESGIEALLDNEVAGGLAPGARVDFYISAGSDLSDGLFSAMGRAVEDDAVDILSVSYLACESSLGASGNELIQEIAEQAAAQGISVVVAAGDNGSAGCDDFDTATTAQGGLAVSGFASTPYNIAVGGTDFDALASSFSTYASTTTSGSAPYYRTATQYIPEKPWNDSTTVNTTVSQNEAYTNSSGATNIVAGSGGASSVYAKPAFQAALTPADGHRDLPDVSLLAGNGFYSASWVVCSDTVADGTGDTTPSSDCANMDGQFSNSTTFLGVGGTSAAAPAFAGMLALAVQATGGRLGQADTVLYQLAKAHPAYFHDITSGDNSVPCVSGSPNCGSNGFMSGYNAGAGYDFATGLGSVDAAAIVNNWKSVSLGSTSTTLEINSSKAAYSGVHGATLTFSTGVTSSSGTPTGVVAITDNADMTAGGTAAGPQNNGQVAIPLTSGSGSVSYNGLPGGSYQVTARYGGDTSYAASTSTPISVSISAEPSTTTLSVDAYDQTTGKAISSSNIPYGSYIIADAAITGTAEGSKTQGAATGTVTFLNGGTTLGTGAVSSENEASWPPLSSGFEVLPAGGYSLTARYSGDASYSSSTSSGVAVTVAKASTSTSVTGPSAVTAPGTFYLSVTTTFLVSVAYGQPDSSPSYTISVNGTNIGTFPEGGDTGVTGSGSTEHPAFTTQVGIDEKYLQQRQNVITVTYTGGTNYTSSSGSVNITDSVGVGSFTLTNGGDLSVTAGGDADGALTLTPSGGFLGSVNVACSVTGAPSGITCSAPLISVTSAAAVNATFFVNTDSTAAAGKYTVVVVASDAATGKISASTSVNLTVAAAPPGLALSSGGSISVAPGAASGNTSTITVTPEDGFTGKVNLACSLASSPSGASDLPTCSIPASVTISGTTAATATLTVKTTAAGSAALKFPLQRFFGGGAALAILFFFGIPARRRAWRAMLCFVAVLFVSGVIGCGGGGAGGGGGSVNSNPGTTAGAYAVTVTGTDAATGKITASTTVSVTVN